ncbi:MAG TPA: adenylate/guanylate cyclase domain-containing protein, partial [Caldilineaceae bacterium]|nr:adenylate/guanylate cyclase domain-containing protein [Caldilineaceae bacterium]
MQSALPYLSIDRRLALATGVALPTRAHGAVLFADISGFTQLTNLLVELYGPRRGAEEATRHLNRVYGALIREVHALGGSVVSFSGDGMLCWFPADEQDSGGYAQAGSLAEAGWRALCAATALHERMAAFQVVALEPGQTTRLGLKVSLAVGEVSRWVVGDPAVQLFDVLAGAPVDRAGAGDQLAARGESVLDEASARLLGPKLRVQAWRTLAETGSAYAVVEPAPGAVRRRYAGYRSPFAPGEEATPRPELVQPWLLPAIYARLQAGQERYLAELRPAVALFLRFQGLDLPSRWAGGQMGSGQAATTPDSPPPTAYSGAAELLDGYVRWVQEVLNRYGAALVQVTTGDKGSYLYAAFGATVVHDDDPERAVAAALELAQTPPHLAPLTAPQIGIARGRMRVGAYGSEQRRTFGVQGAAANLAARLMMAAQPGQIVVDAAVAAAVAETVRLEQLAPAAIKGLEQAQTLYRVVGMSVPAPASPKGIERRFVGRQRELAQLLDAATRAASGQGQVVEVYGPAGIGKSTLLAHLAAHLVSKGWLAAQGQGQGARRHVAYGALGQLLRGLLGLPLPEPGREPEMAASLYAWVEAVNPAWRPRLPLLREVLGAPLAETPAIAALDPRSRQQATAALVGEMVAAAAARQPVLLLVDDSQWLDEATVAVMDALIGRVDELRALIVLARRTGEEAARPPAWDVSLALPLGGLEAADLDRLIQARLGGPIEPITGALLSTLSQGNPLYLEQVLEAMAAAGRLVQDEVGWQLAPAAVEGLRASRALVATETGWRLVPEAATLSGLLGLPESL